MISNGLGSFANLGGGYGLRLGGLPVQYIVIPEINEDSIGLSIVFFSSSGEKVASLQSGRGQAEVLESELSFKKYGNMENFSINLKRNNELPLFTGMGVLFLNKNKRFAYGYVDEVPETDQNSGIIKIIGSGYSKKLKDKQITLSVTNQTVKQVIDTIGTAYFSDLGFDYDSTKNQAPATYITAADWKDKSIEKIIEDLISISNESFDTVEYIYGIDEFGSFYFRGIVNNNPASGYFEGFNYQNAKTEKNEKSMINRVLLFRTTSANPDVTEFVNTYEDSDSIDKNGIFEKKLVISDYVDNTTAENIALGIIGNGKDPKTRVKVSDLLTDNFLNFDFYALNNKKQEQKIVVAEFTSLTEWVQSLTTSTIVLRDTTVFSGRLCYQWDITNSVGDNISQAVEYFSPKFMRVYLRQDVAGEFLKITATGLQGKIHRNLVTNVPANIVTNVPTNFVVNVDSSGLATGIADIGVPTANEWVAVNIDLTGFFKIESIAIEVIKTDVVEILIDRLEIYTESYVKRILSLEEITYKFSNTDLIATDAIFGQEKITLTEKLNKIDKKNRIAYDIFSKQ